ncbi:unnamed protein product [Eruca vesicaria subsp. sativa]|uniref:Uncharacterized protein n=1 Tax=Eruca vesicaria subsp. sativa TaxID=29727 RepID=A0ABC8JSE9_ERUVS|nr:unnamed protein product [Eruca vesicaria subsp. sativa]
MATREISQGRAQDSMVKIMNKKVTKKGEEDERQKSIETRPEKRAKTVTESRERFEDVEKSVPYQDKLQKQSTDETEANDEQNMEQQKDTKKKEKDVRFRLEHFYNRQRTKKQRIQVQQQEMKLPQEPAQQQPLASHFHLYPVRNLLMNQFLLLHGIPWGISNVRYSQLVEKLANAVETGTRDQNYNALYVDGQKRKLEDTAKLDQQIRELIVEYRKSIEDILKIEPYYSTKMLWITHLQLIC